MPDTEAAPPAFQDERVARLHAYWAERRGSRKFPARADLDPAGFAFILGNLVLMEVQHDPLRFRFRVHGVNLVLRDGYDMTGRWLHEHPEPQYSARILRTYEEVVASGECFHVIRDIEVDGRVRRYESLVLPLGRDDATVDMIMGAQVYLD